MFNLLEIDVLGALVVRFSSAAMRTSTQLTACRF
jgi:hypothetical protein